MDSSKKNNGMETTENTVSTTSTIIATSNNGPTTSTSNNLNITFGQQHSLGENVFRNQPIMCPWITVQPYPSTAHLNNSMNHKNRFNNGAGNCSNNTCTGSNWPGNGKACGNNPASAASMQYSNTCFFYFLRMMQLFPDVHPATLHTVLTICKNDFFSAVDKLLYAKRCKTVNNKRLQRRAQCAPYANKTTLSAKELKHTPVVIVNNNSTNNPITIGSVTPGNANVMVEPQPQMQILHPNDDQHQKGSSFEEICAGQTIVDINNVEINVPNEGSLIEMPENILEEKEIVFTESSDGSSTINEEKVIVENPEDLSSTVVITSAI